MPVDNLLSDRDRPSSGTLAAWFQSAHTGDGTPWLRAAQADVLARYALARGEGLCMMEASALSFREPPRDTGWEILGADPDGQNWTDHNDPQRAYALFKAKVRMAQTDGAVLQYKLWFAPPSV